MPLRARAVRRGLGGRWGALARHAGIAKWLFVRNGCGLDVASPLPAGAGRAKWCVDCRRRGAGGSPRHNSVRELSLRKRFREKWEGRELASRRTLLECRPFDGEEIVVHNAVDAAQCRERINAVALALSGSSEAIFPLFFRRFGATCSSFA